MQQLMLGKEARLNRMNKIIEKLMSDRPIYQARLNQGEITQQIVKLFDNFSSEQLSNISDDDLTDRIDAVMMIGALAGILNDMTTEEMKLFDEAVQRK